MYTNNRDAYRQAFFTAWQKYQNQVPLEPLEKQLVEVMLLHPEYHDLLSKPHAYQQQMFTLEENPFFHLSLHLAIRDQLTMQRPAEVIRVYQTLLEKIHDPHEVEHMLLQCLAQVIWQAQQEGSMPNEEEYKRLVMALLTPR